MSDEIRIYVADLAAYNNGYLHGVWIDATLELDDVQAEVTAMLANSPEGFAEEWAIHDYEGFGHVHISEYDSFKRLHDLALFIQEHGNLGAEVLNYFGGDLEDATKAIEFNYFGQYESVADYAQSLTEDTTQIPESLAAYIDYERLGRDMELFSPSRRVIGKPTYSGRTKEVRSMKNKDVFTIEWESIEIEITYVKSYSGAFEYHYGYPISHIEIRTINPAKAPLPITQTGYRSHFMPSPVPKTRGQVIDMIVEQLDKGAKSKEWKEREAKFRQYQLL